MIFRPFHRHESGCASYLLGCGGEGLCAVVDPLEPFLDAYVAFAEAKGMRITHVLETHVHADHRSTGRALAERTGALYALHRSADVDFPFEPLDDGQELALGNVRLRVMHTPGHSHDSVCYVVTDLRRGPAPWFVLTGDTLFVGAVGRPDLPSHGGHARENALALYASLHERLLTLPDTVEVYPGHFSGSLCGAGLSGKPSSTLAFEKQFNPMLALDAEAFVRALEDAPPRPDDLDAIVAFNSGRACCPGAHA